VLVNIVPKVLQARERATTTYFFSVFILNSHLNLLKRLGAHLIKMCYTPLERIF